MYAPDAIPVLPTPLRVLDLRSESTILNVSRQELESIGTGMPAGVFREGKMGSEERGVRGRAFGGVLCED
jgi:hypothetical protein